MPVNMPAYAFTDLNLTPVDGAAYARSEGGLLITSRRSDPFWRGPMTTRPLNVNGPDNEHADFLAFLSQCVDLNLRVDFVHPRHRLPRAYDVDTWPMTGDATLEDVPDLRAIEVSGLTVGLVLKRGDRLSIIQGDIVCHRWIAEDVAVSSAISEELPITPRLPIGVFAAEAIVRLKDPIMRLMIVPGSWEATEAAEASSISFEVGEALR